MDNGKAKILICENKNLQDFIQNIEEKDDEFKSLIEK